MYLRVDKNRLNLQDGNEEQTVMADRLEPEHSVICTPFALDDEARLRLGAQADERRLQEAAQQAGPTRFRRATELPLNLVTEGRL